MLIQDYRLHCPFFINLLIALSFSCPNYAKVQFCVVRSLAFYAFLQVGEMTAPNKGACPPIQLCQLTQLVDSTGKIVSLKLIFTDYKHNYNRHLFPLSSTASHPLPS